MENYWVQQWLKVKPIKDYTGIGLIGIQSMIGSPFNLTLAKKKTT